MTHDVKNIGLALEGKRRIEWAERDMPVLRQVREEFAKNQPFKGMRFSACLHVTAETANLMRTMKAGGADVVLVASNPLSTQDDVAASLTENFGIPVFAIRGEDRDTFFKHIKAAIAHNPVLTMDDGADLISTIHNEHPDMVKQIVGSMEETTTGVIRLRAMAKDGALKIPVVAVNDAKTKNLFDNRYGTGQSTLDGIIRATGQLIAGKTIVVAGYGWCGKGFAMRARGMGARVVVTEIDSIKALEAVMDGFEVMSIKKAASVGDVFCTVTGDINVIDQEHFPLMKDGAVLCNSGHFDVEINLKALAALAEKMNKDVSKNVDEYIVNGKRIYVLGEGRLVNLAAAEGHPASVMDMSFATQALAAAWVVMNKGKLTPQVYDIDPAIEKRVADLKLASMGITIDTLTPEQKKYLESWEHGT
ncbi:adenosylhomocysteinase [Candidatus Kaiserbacteria bacterium RIFCSPHIGHO2_01_FULL_48_10]|uniref:Adenosylhomocysteinase n=1 Tax=Candidatus Kaiserbacteria bacterium RIFCSPHIGHO2_01_FULL_48_10 TaxID=1798476 RepID=A0A1F6C317_9BACT|nr:MAG: adenosylhomocysteinase [Candidatus Kaiserbacteria bacterium RIFCSPHIGHO2_01_FULL_48_10]